VPSEFGRGGVEGYPGAPASTLRLYFAKGYGGYGCLYHFCGFEHGGKTDQNL